MKKEFIRTNNHKSIVEIANEKKSSKLSYLLAREVLRELDDKTEAPEPPGWNKYKDLPMAPGDENMSREEIDEYLRKNGKAR